MEEESINNIHIVRFYFNTHSTSVQLHQFVGDEGHIFIEDEKTGLKAGDRIVRIGLGKKFTDVRNLDSEAILALIPKKENVKICFDVLTGNYDSELDLPEVSTF